LYLLTLIQSCVTD